MRSIEPLVQSIHDSLTFVMNGESPRRVQHVIPSDAGIIGRAPRKIPENNYTNLPRYQPIGWL